MNDENLIPMNKRSKSEQRALQSKGGKKSGEVRRWKADIKACILDKLGNDATMEEFVSVVFDSAMNGNPAAWTFIRDTAGQKPSDKTMLTGPNGGPLETLQDMRVTFVRPK